MVKILHLPLLFFALLFIPGTLLAQKDLVSTEFHGKDASLIVKNSKHVRWNNVFSIPSYVEYRSENGPVVGQAKNILLANFNNSSSIGFNLTNTETDQLGWTHYRYQQTYSNFPVEGSMVIVHAIGAKVISYNGEMFTGISIASSNPKYNEKWALSKALSYVNAYTYKWQVKGEEDWLKYEVGDSEATYYPKGELVIKAEKDNLTPGHFHLCWKFNIYAVQPLGRYNVYVNTETGTIIDAEDLIHTDNVIGSAATKYSGTQSIHTDSTAPGNYRLRQTVNGNGIETYNMQKGTSYNSTDFTDADNYWNNINANKDEIATDAHFGAEQTYIYYKTSHNRKSYDNKDSKLRNYVHYSTAYDNAFWDGQRMTYGDGSQLKPLVSIDITGHEITHGVTGNTAKLTYNGESGALNESFSDIFGTAIEFKVKASSGGGNFVIGEDVTPGGSGIRNMRSPSLFSNPGAYYDNYWYIGAADNGGVHTNSGVQNKWFYIIAKGETGTNFKNYKYNVKGVGLDTAAKICYRTLTYYLTPNTKYYDARFYSIRAAKDLYGTCSDAVKQVTNAWAAVNVGAPMDTIATADFFATPNIYCSVTDTVQIYNNSQQAATFNWNFGDGQTSTAENPKHVYSSFGYYDIKLAITGCQGGKDTAFKSAYIKVDSSLGFCKAILMPKAGSANVQTACTGAVKDDGGDLNYSDGTDGSITISPTNASYIKLLFNSFNMESPGDYLYIYDGPNTSSKLIGKYTGTNLPNGGTVLSTGGSVTLRQVSNNATNMSGYEISWQCYQRISNDVGILSIKNKTGRENTSIAFKQTESITVVIKNFGSNNISNIPISYKINGNADVNETIAQTLKADSTLTYTFTTTSDLSTSGYYDISCWTSLTGDTVNYQNNGIYGYRIKHISNKPVTLPYLQTFETDADITYQDGVIGLDSTDAFDYENNTPGNGRLRTNAGAGYARGGLRAITFDQFPATNTNGPYNINYLILTLNMSNYTSDKLLLDFSYMSSGDEDNANDRVWVRGDDQAAWKQVYNLGTNAAAIGTYKDASTIDLSAVLTAAGQTPSKSFQLRFGQEDNGSSSNPTQNDGYTFDNIRVWRQVNDISVSNIITPQTACGLTASEPLKVEITNNGYYVTNTTVPISYRINGGSVVTENVSLTLNPNQVYNYTFTQHADLSASGNYIIESWTAWSSDKDHSNDSNSVYVTSFPGVPPVNITVSGQLNFCQGDSVLLTASSGFNSYSWNTGNSSSTLVVKTSGTYSCTVSNAYGCTLTSSSTVVTVKLKPSSGYNWNISGNNVQFTNLSGNADSYKWYFGDGDSATAIHPTHNYTAAGSYKVTLVATNGCGTSSSVFTLKVGAVGINSPEESVFVIYPNPAHELLTLSNLHAGKSFIVKLTDLSGKQLAVYNTNGASSLQFDVSHLPAGMYMLDCGTFGKYKFVKQ